MSTQRSLVVRWTGYRLAVVCAAAALLASPLATAQAPAEQPEARTVPASLTAWRSLADAPITDLTALLEQRVPGLPMVAEPQARGRMLRASASAVDTLPDPVVKLGVDGIPWTSWSLAESGMSGIQLEASWTLPWPGQLSAGSEALKAQAVTTESESGERALMVEVDATMTYWDIAGIDLGLEALEDIEAVVVQARKLAEVRYRFGTTGQGDIVQAGLELTDLDAMRLAMLEMRSRRVAELNGMLQRPAAAEVVPPRPLSVEPLGEDVDALVARAEAERPLFDTLLAREGEIAARQRATELMGYPMFMVGAGYRVRFETGAAMDPTDGEDFLGAMVGVTLPFGSSARADDELAMLEAERAMVGLDREEARRAIRARIETDVTTLRELETQLEFVAGTLIPDAQAGLDALLSVYPTGGADLLDVFMAEQRVLELEIRRRDLVARHWMVREVLARYVGSSEVSSTP